MNEPTIYEHAHLAYFGNLGWKIDKAEYQSDKPIEFGKHGQGPIGTAEDWQDAIDQIIELEDIRSAA